jgi:hypothetical protein
MERTKSVPVGISLPTGLIHKIDTERKDIPRSKYILRLIEKEVTVNV